ncbi:hypothetical protein ACHHYP_00448 [Achlya hypogyna]|uniref:Uncharacterized protein n=1 Tax=Achlya hypogyna TaxID=1202772 RepID=A0A1V9ZB53_ACHHY|nr:hypothetical protein ACHHYP_00448 [Achlya hypogyna]
MATETDAYEGAGAGSTLGVFTASPGCAASEHLSGSPLLPDNVRWSQDGKLAIVVHDGIMISTFVNKDLCRYLLQPPFVSRTNIPLSKRPATTKYPLAPPPLVESDYQRVEVAGTVTYRIMNSFEAVTSANPRELSLAKPDCDVYLQAVWGPRGSAPNASCALLALTAANRILLYVPNALHLNWPCTAVLSDTLAVYLESIMDDYAPLPPDPFVPLPLPRAPKRPRHEKSYAEDCDFMATMCVAWSDKSLLAFCGRRLTTLWQFDAASPTFIGPSPVATVDTGVHGWPTVAAWTADSSALVIGTSLGRVLLVTVDGHLERVWRVPGAQPVVSVTAPTALVVAAFGRSLGVWDLDDASDAQPRTWTAHDGAVAVVASGRIDQTIYSGASDGALKAWTPTGTAVAVSNLPTKGYPIFGLCLSPNDVLVTATYLLPPAARPCRTTQADTTYSRVSGGLEHFAAPAATTAPVLAATLEELLTRQSTGVDSLFDALALCHFDQGACTAKETELRSLELDSSGVVPLYRPVADALVKAYTELPLESVWAPPTLLQAAYQIWSTIPVRPEAPHWVVHAILCHHAEQHVRTAAKATLSSEARTSALLMADYLWLVATLGVEAPVSFALKPHTAAAVRQLYTKYGTAADVARLDAGAGDLPVRESCGLCKSGVPLTPNVLEPTCAKGHAVERSFLSFRLLSHAVVWKCTMCDGFADVDAAASFYLPMGKPDTLHCRVCGSYCQELTY